MPKPCRPELRFGSFEQLLADVDQLHTGGWEKTGEWSLAMVSDHLARGMNLMLDGGMPSIPRPFRWIARAVIRRMVRTQKYPTLSIRAPRVMRPIAEIAEPAAVAEIRTAVARLQNLTGPTVYAHPFGTLSVHDFHQMILLHAAHHLAYLRPQVQGAAHEA